MPDQSNSGAGPSFAILGAGFAGLAMAIRLRKAGYSNFTIYEKADAVGGTWRDNRYPGVACDVPSHLYSLSDAPNPDWREHYASGGEIQDYILRLTDEHDLYPHIRFGKEVAGLIHDGAQWRISFADGSAAAADIAISGLGGLHAPNIPDFPGLADFAGPVFHTARWRDDVSLAGRRVAVIGSAASAVQAVPHIAAAAAHVDVYQRTANWIMPRGNYRYPDWLRGLFRSAPALAAGYRWIIFSAMEARFPAFRSGPSRIKAWAERQFRRHLESAIDDPALRAKLTPDYPIGCKRILISDDYFPAIARSNVDLVTSGIDRFVRGGVIDKDGVTRAADVVVLATGFKPFNILETIDIVGPAGDSLRDRWTSAVEAHRTIAAPGFPNLFFLLGPNSALGHNSVLLMIEAAADAIIDLVKRSGAQSRPLVEADAAACREWNDSMQARLAKRVWAANCGAWYVDAAGRNYTLYPDNVRAYQREMAQLDPREFGIRNALI